MLGDMPIFGSFSCGVDEKGRIILPSYFNSEAGEQIVLCTENNQQLTAYSLKVLSDKVIYLDTLAITSTNDNVVRKVETIRKELCSSANEQVKVDSHHRIAINNSLLEVFGTRPAKLYGLGEGNRIKFFGSEESYQEYTGRLYVKKGTAKK